MCPSHWDGRKSARRLPGSEQSWGSPPTRTLRAGSERSLCAGGAACRLGVIAVQEGGRYDEDGSEEEDTTQGGRETEQVKSKQAPSLSFL